MNFLEIIDVAASIIGLLSDLNELSTSDTNLGIMVFSLFHNKKEKNPNLRN